MTEQQQTSVADLPAEPPEVPAEPAGPPAVRKDRPKLRAALRWTAAVVVFAVAGAGTAYGITRMERTDVPGLATESDGRWDYPLLTKPPLPSGSPGPQAESNPAGTHHADLRALLLPAPEGAEENGALRGTQGWLPADAFLEEIAEKEDRDEFRQRLVDWGLRHIAARGWTTEDGTRTRIYLLRFDTAAVADDRFHGVLFPYTGPAHRVTGTENVVSDETFPEAATVAGVQRTVYDEAEPRGAEHDRQAYLVSGDVLAVVLQSRKGTAHAVPFRQTVVLQSQLLG
ncbi:hypothetical protein [Streptomyces sp. BSE7-9]|uniref:hypothetical protein n=1 Tax=Streptomyces sp. BSE7-9 TaxID=2759948 RepID=UPI0013D83EF6|nr:hypothetical protein [Streptomyces sp. BSE7-9]MBJ6645283.1 hypothetical protein [Streptomyces sp. BSE7-9]NEA93840.1 hypothetical protein [Actinospica acidiphila]